MAYFFLTYGVTVLLGFAGGAYFGAKRAPAVTNAIAALKAAEQSAQKTLSEIMDHKKS